MLFDLSEERRGQETHPENQQEIQRLDLVQTSEKDRGKAERRQRKDSRKRDHRTTTVSKNWYATVPAPAALPNCTTCAQIARHTSD